MLSNIYNTSVGQMSGYYQTAAPQRTMTFNLTKHIKKVFKYDDNISTVTNDNIYIAIGSTQTDGTGVGATAVGTYQMITHFDYKDA